MWYTYSFPVTVQCIKTFNLVRWAKLSKIAKNGQMIFKPVFLVLYSLGTFNLVWRFQMRVNNFPFGQVGQTPQKNCQKLAKSLRTFISGPTCTSKSKFGT